MHALKMMTLIGLTWIAALLLFFSTPSFSQSTSSEATLFSDGVGAAAFADVSVSSLPGAGKSRNQPGLGASVGWQAVRVSGQALAVGFGATAISGDQSMIYGPEISLALLNDRIISLMGTYSPSKGYFRRESFNKNEDRYRLFTANRLEGKIFYAVTESFKIGLIAGHATINIAPAFKAEKLKIFNGGTSYGVCVRLGTM
jgi:hypothetical protein